MMQRESGLDYPFGSSSTTWGNIIIEEGPWPDSAAFICGRLRAQSLARFEHVTSLAQSLPEMPSRLVARTGSLSEREGPPDTASRRNAQRRVYAELTRSPMQQVPVAVLRSI